MEPIIECLLERSRARINIAEKERLRGQQLLCVGCETKTASAFSQKQGAANSPPVFKVPTMNNLGLTKSDRYGKENKSPPKDCRKPSVAVIAPNVTEMYPRRPPRCVYNSPLLFGTEASNPQIFEDRYKPKNTCPSRAESKPVLNIETFGSKAPVEGDRKNTDNLYPSLPKVNTSYDLDRLAKEQNTEEEKPELPIKCCRTPPNKMDKTEDVNISFGRVKKIVKKFSQTSLVSPPNNSPVRVPQKFEKFTRSPLASSTVNSLVKVVPKLYYISEPTKPEFLDTKKASPKSETPKILPADSQPILPAHETVIDTSLNLSSYNVDNFLKDALGSEFQSISSIYSEPAFAHDSSVTSNDSSAEMSRNTSPPGFSLRLDYSVRPHIQIDVNEERRSSLESLVPFETSGTQSPTADDRIKRLKVEASIQRSLVAQTSKALYLCRTEKQFKESRELVEGERILLLASLRTQACLEEIKNCDQPQPKSASRGSLTVSDIFVPLKWDIFPKLDRTLCPQWFLCVLTLGDTVQATEAVNLVDHRPMLQFPGSMHLSDLSCDFRARLHLYSFGSPLHTRKQKNKLVRACQMLRRPTRNCLGPAGSSEDLMYLRNPAFKMIGCTELTVSLINQPQPVSCSLQQVPMVSLIKGTINFRLSAQLLNTPEHSGFLNVLRPAGTGNAWQRWWCHLDGRILRCWNYPADQEHKEPVFYLDLLKCLSEKVVLAPRVLCARPRTILLETEASRGLNDVDSTLVSCSSNSIVMRHFLSCDTISDMTQWASAINKCLEALRLWNIIPETKNEQRPRR